MVEMGVVIEALKTQGLQDKLKVLIGGAAVSDEYAREIDTDAYLYEIVYRILSSDLCLTTDKERM